MLDDIKKLTIELLEDAKNNIKDVKSIENIAEILQVFTYLMDICLGKDFRKIQKCLNYLNTKDYLKIIDLLNEG